MGEINDPDHAEDEREADAEKGVDAPEEQSVDEKLGQDHGALFLGFGFNGGYRPE
jgi:hypothetical protein